jgi:hypothetical protein
VLGLLLLCLGASLILLLLIACAVDDTGNPHPCPESYLALAVMGVAAALASALTARLGWRGRGSLTILSALGGAVLLVLLLFYLEGTSLP